MNRTDEQLVGDVADAGSGWSSAYDAGTSSTEFRASGIKLTLAKKALIDRLTTLSTDNEALRTYAHEITKTLTNLVGGGSEMFGRKIGEMYTADLEYCEKVLRNRTAEAFDRWTSLRRHQQTAETQALRVRLEEAERVAQPFAEAAEGIPDNKSYAAPACYIGNDCRQAGTIVSIPVSAFRAAKAFLASKGGA